MTQEEKQLLLKDLCARLPYKVKVEAVPYVGPQILCSIDPIRKEFRLDFGGYRNIFAVNWVCEVYSIVKPYLRPMSSMTEEEKKEYKSFFRIGEYTSGGSLEGEEYEYIDADSDDISQPTCLIDWLLEHHFDFRGLIEKGLALEAPEDMYKIKQNLYGEN